MHKIETASSLPENYIEEKKILERYPLLLKAWETGILPPRMLISIQNNPDLAISLEQSCSRGQESIRQILADSSMLRVRDFAEILLPKRNFLCSCRIVNKLRQKRQVIALQESKYKRYYYPKWQINPRTHEVYPVIAKLLESLSYPLSVYNFLMNKNPAFKGETGLDVMRSENYDLLCNAAEGQAQGNFS